MYATVSLSLILMRKNYLYSAPSNVFVSMTSSSEHMRDLALLYTLGDRRGSGGSPIGVECLDFDANTIHMAIQHIVRNFEAI